MFSFPNKWDEVGVWDVVGLVGGWMGGVGVDGGGGGGGWGGGGVRQGKIFCHLK